MDVKPHPFYLRFTLVLLSIFLLGALIYLGRDILMPLCFSAVLAILLLPVHQWLIKRGVGEVLALFISITASLLVIVAIVYFLFTQVSAFAEDLPKIKQNLNHHLSTIQAWVRENWSISKKEQEQAVEQATVNLKQTGPGLLGTTFISAASAIAVVILLPIYTFLFMYYRKMIKTFLIAVFTDKHRSKVEDVLQDSRIIIQGYMVGLIIELAIVAALNAAGFLIIGIDYAIFLAVLAAILNMIPYIGMLIAGIVCMLVTLANTNEIGDVLWVAAVLTLVQFIDNNFLMPYVVSSKVKINALISIIGVLVGGALAGVSGMFLSIPGIAIMKSIFDRVDDLKPWGIILGDDRAPDRGTVRKMIRKKVVKK